MRSQGGTEFRDAFTGDQVPTRRSRNHGRVIDLPDVFAVALMLLTVALFAVMIWAGNHTH
jgi:hypothetical protein